MDKRRIGISERSLSMYLTGNYKREEIIKEMQSLYAGTDEDKIVFLMDNTIEIYESLIQAIIESGGNPDFVKKDMYFMTVIELLSILSTNDVRFYFKKQKTEVEENKLSEEDLKNIDELVNIENKLIEKAIEDEIETDKIIDEDAPKNLDEIVNKIDKDIRRISKTKPTKAEIKIVNNEDKEIEE